LNHRPTDSLAFTESALIPLEPRRAIKKLSVVEQYALSTIPIPLNSPYYLDIHYDMIKNLPIIGKLELLKIYNEIYLDIVFPTQWREALIVPILKHGKDPKYAKNYRPISLTNCICKILERIINKRLCWFLESNDLLSFYQAGFRKNRSTADNLA
jgi:hypothetical protein